jgi:hypothetical protein
MDGRATVGRRAFGGGGAGGKSVPRLRRRRVVVSVVTVVGLAAAIIGVVALGGLEPVGVAPPVASAAEILHQAADAVREQPITPPRPDQFVYTRTQDRDGAVREAWLSVDGTHDGLIVDGDEREPLPGCRVGEQAGAKGGETIPNASDPCTPLPAYRSDLPTDAAGMREFLKENSTGQIGKDILYYFDALVPPESLAALFDVIAGFPELTVDEHVTDGAGRPGIGVSWTRDGHVNTMVFDSTTHVFLGFAGFSAVVERVVTDTVGQRP